MLDAPDWQMAMSALTEQFEADNPFDRGELQVGERTLRIFIARTPEQRARGMIGRRFGAFDAMLFDLGEMKVAHFHNEGVEVAILIAFYAEDGELVGVQVMEAGAGEVTSKDPCRYVLELPADERGLLPDTLSFLAELAPRVCDCDNYTGSENGRCERCGGVLMAAEIKKPKDQVNLRAADPKDRASCPECLFFLGAGVCELVQSGAGVGLVCDEFTDESERDPSHTQRWTNVSPPQRTA